MVGGASKVAMILLLEANETAPKAITKPVLLDANWVWRLQGTLVHATKNIGAVCFVWR
jgi:hypothetical protein